MSLRILAFVLLLAAVACKEDKFRATGGQSGANVKAMRCSTGSGDRIQSLRGGKDGVAIDVELCPAGLEQAPANPLQVVFVIDFSGSMARVDPKKDGTCHRMAAIRTVAENYLRGVPSPKAVQFSVVSFAAEAQIHVQKVDGNVFMQGPVRDPANFCEAIYATKDMTYGNTNYEDGFSSALELLISSQNLDKRIYFISDGYPTLSSTILNQGDVLLSGKEQSRIAIEDTLTVVKKIRALPLIEIYGLFMGWSPTEEEEFDFEMEPEELMTQITGDRVKVKVMAESKDLPVLIGDFSPQEPIPLTADRIAIEVRADGFDPQVFAVDPTTFEADPQAQKPLVFKTLPLKFFGSPGRVVRNQVIISAQDSRYAPVVYLIDWEEISYN